MEGAVAGLVDDLPEIEATSPSLTHVAPVVAAGKKPMKQPRVEKAAKGAKSVRGGNVLHRTGGKVPRKTLGKKRPMMPVRDEDDEDFGEGDDGEVGGGGEEPGPKKKIRDGTEVAVDRLAKAQEAVIREERNAVTAVSKALAKRVRNTILDTATKDKIERVIRTIRDRVAPETAVMKTSDFEKFTSGGFDRGERVRMFRFVLQKGQSNKSTNTLEILSVEGILKPEAGGGVRISLVLRCGKRGSNDEDEEEDELDFEKAEGVKRLIKFAHSYTNKKYKPIPIADEEGTGELIGDEEEVDLAGMSNDQCNLVRNNFLVNMATQLCWLQKALDATMRPPGQYISTQMLRRLIYDRMEA